MRALTERQEQVLIYIEDFIQSENYPPTMREIGKHFGMSPKGAHDHVLALKKKGAIYSEARKMRTIKLAKKTGTVHGGEHGKTREA